VRKKCKLRTEADLSLGKGRDGVAHPARSCASHWLRFVKRETAEDVVLILKVSVLSDGE